MTTADPAGATGHPSQVRELTGDELAGWDAAAVAAPGGHVYQSRAWADHRAAQGWRPRFLAVGERRALVLVRPWPVLGGGSAYCPRGPVGAAIPWALEPAEDDPAGRGEARRGPAGAAEASGTPRRAERDHDTPGTPGTAGPRGSRDGDALPVPDAEDPAAGATTGAALAAIAAHLAADGVDVMAADPEVAADDPGYARAVLAAGFRPIPEIQPSRHRMALPLPPDGDGGAVFEGIAKATRQRIRRAERDATCVLRWDAAAGDHDGFVRATEDPAAAFDRFYGLLRVTGDRRGFGFAGPAEFTGWWRRALAAGHLVYLEAREGAPDGDVLGGLVLYRHGVRLSTQHSADRAERRRDHPGAMHLLRWRAIQLAVAEGRTEMDLGGVDVAGARRRPVEGEPTYGLYEHKRSFGARWVALAGARERVARPWRYAAGRAAARVAKAVGR